MASYGSGFYEAGFGEYYTTPPTYDATSYYDTVPSYVPGFSEYDPTPYYSSDAYDLFPTHSEINRSMYRVSEPLRFEYNPISSYTKQYPSDTQFIISYSTINADQVDDDDEDDDTDYEEYDPTPYDGGYDPTLTYGKPLPPSTEICYPRSSPVSGNSLSPDKVSNESVPANPSFLPGPIESNEEKKQDEPEKGIGDSEVGADEPDSRAGYGYGVGVIEQVPRLPYGYGLEAMDLCETLFGYWPCLDKQKRMNNARQGVAFEDDELEKQWSCAADYLFGSPNGYGGFEGGNYWEPNCNYERHYQRENHSQVESTTWLLNSTAFSESSSSSSSSW